MYQHNTKIIIKLIKLFCIVSFYNLLVSAICFLRSNANYAYNKQAYAYAHQIKLTLTTLSLHGLQYIVLFLKWIKTFVALIVILCLRADRPNYTNYDVCYKSLITVQSRINAFCNELNQNNM